LLACAGLYGVLSYSVSRRTQEIGIRMALGAKRTDVLTLVLRQGMSLAVLGIAIGLSGAFVVTRYLESLLFEVRAADPLTFAVTSVALAAVALAACYLPARRATRVDPVITLRSE